MRLRNATLLLVSVIVASASRATLCSAQRPLTADQIARLTDARAGEAFRLYRELLSFPNDAKRPDDIARLSDWVEAEFAKRSFKVTRLPMPGSDALLATRAVPGAKRTVLVYLQADGQPVDPSRWFQESPWTATLKARRAGATSVDGNPNDWETLPWERLYQAPDPEWRMFARSASDSKGPVAQFLTAISMLDDAGASPNFNLKVIIDTEEELGSPHLADAVVRHRDELAADMLVIFDGPPHNSGRPSLTFGARGIATVTLTTYGPIIAQHSGHWGNYVPNPAMRLAQVLASMKDDRGRVTIPGFYDGVQLDEETRRVLAAVPDDIAAIHRRMAIAAPDSVAPTLQESLQYPSLNVRGMSSGWVGDDARTIVPPTAVAEIDVRLVPESDPGRLLDLMRRHIEQLGYTIVSGRDPTIEERARHPRLIRFDHDVSYAAFRTPFDSPAGRWLASALERVLGHPPIMERTSGGSIPIAPFVSTLGLPAVSVGTVNPDNNQHSPNENLRVFDFLQGIRIIAGVLSQPLPLQP